MHFEVAARVRGRDTSVLMRIFDQGNSVLGRVDGMGFGLRAASATPGTTGSATPIPGGVRLLPFCIVAKVPICDDKQLAAVYDDLRRRGIGSGSFERWQSTTTIYVYDVERSVGFKVPRQYPGQDQGRHTQPQGRRAACGLVGRVAQLDENDQERQSSLAFVWQRIRSPQDHPRG